jgi:hypothetical protein
MSRSSTLNRTQRRIKGQPAENREKLLTAVAGLGRILDAVTMFPDKVTANDCALIAGNTIELVGFKWTKRENK